MKTKTLLLLLVFPFAVLHAQTQITLDDIWKNNTFGADYAGGFSSMADGTHYMDYAAAGDNHEKALVEYDFKTGNQTAVLLYLKDLIPDGMSAPVNAQNIILSPDEKKALIVTESEQIYRYSTKVMNYVYDLQTKKMFPLSNGGKQRLATFSPDSKKVVFMRDNNIFLVDIASQKETQVTTDGEWNKIINGAPDWVYEEEFSFTNGMFWSPDSKKLAFYKMDESRVKEFQMTMYNTGLYPEPYSYKYPKAGEDNSIVSVHIYDVDSKQTIKVDVGSETNQYIPRVMWIDAKTLGFLRMNRLQNFNELLFADASAGSSKVIFSEKSNTYLEVYDPIFLPDGKSFLWTSDMDGWVHEYNVGIDGKIIKQVTKGEWDITSVYGYDPVAKLLYYQSDEGNATQRDVYSIKLDGTGKKKLSTKAGTNDAEFSSGMKYYMNTWSSANVPYYSTLNSADGKEIKVLVDNHELLQKTLTYGFSKKEFFNFKDRDGVSLNGWMIKPAKMDAGKKYPVLMVVYGGPGNNMVNDAWSGRDFSWHQMLAQQGYIIACVDNRGTEYRGRDFKKCTYGQMGKLESADQIDASKYLGGLDYIDGKRVGIWGWSYGGYMSSLCLGVGADYFKIAIAVAPVTSWRFYDSIYTERYMGLPQDNAHGYDDFSPVNNVAGIKGKLLLCHGTGDDNVHFQNSVALTDALIDANKQYDFYMYPDRNHGISGGNTRMHLYTKMTNFIKENL
ncbi:MAG TPA: S9 family peptidase [Bacteroidia bacterium]|jgi:dipeptidyl-peptidase-4|nr:S9 family peptidase [Bacteroidia bacterium]